MFKNFLKQLEKSVQKGVLLEQNCAPDLLLKIANSEACKKATEQFLAVEEGKILPSLVGRGKNVIELYQNENWEVSMVRQSLFKVEPFLVSSPNPVLVHCIAGEGTSKLCFYKINGDPEALSTAKDWTLSQERVIEIKKGDVFSCNNPNLVMDFLELSSTHIFLRFVHRPISPLLFVFERESQKFSYHTFSDEVSTGQFFFSDLINQMVNNPDCKAIFSDQQSQDVIEFCNKQIGNETLNMSTRWKLLQTLGLVAEENAKNWLEKFSSHPDPGVSQVARATLSEISTKGDQT